MDGQPRKEKKQLTESHADTPTHTLGTLDLDAPTPNSDSECSPRRPGGTLADRQAGVYFAGAVTLSTWLLTALLLGPLRKKKSRARLHTLGSASCCQAPLGGACLLPRACSSEACVVGAAALPQRFY